MTPAGLESEVMTEFAAPLPILARYAVMVDVGYIYAAAGELLFATSSRREFRVDAVPLIQVVTKHADEIIRGELLRVYWYDAARDRVPIAGDEDMVPAVEAAQAFGVRVHLWGIEPPYGTNQAERLVWESDTVDVLERSFVEPYFTRQLTPEPTPAAAASGEAALVRGQQVAAQAAPSPAQVFGERHASRPMSRPLPITHLSAARLGPDRERVEEAGEHVAQKWILTRGEDNIRDLLPGPILPPVIDKELLVDAEKELGLSLRAYQEAREWLRDAFWARVHRQFGLGIGKSKG